MQLDSPYTYFLFLLGLAYIIYVHGCAHKVIKHIMAVFSTYHTFAYFIYKAEKNSIDAFTH